MGVVVPARNAEAVLPACLWSLLTQQDVPAMDVVVVANACSDDTAAVARSHAELAARHGHRLEVVETAVAGKGTALNRGEAILATELRLFVDAGVVLSPEAVAALAAALRTPAPRIAAPAPAVYEPPAGDVRSFFRLRTERRSVRGHVIGGGVYAVNAAGRRRWGEFPDPASDDSFLRTRFAPEEQIVLPDHPFLLVPPATIRRRRAAGDERPSAAHRRSPPLPRIHAVVVTHNSEREIADCLRSLAPELSDGQLTVSLVDNASSDETVSIARRALDRVDVVQEADNLGFSRAANRGAARRPPDTDWLLFLNPDTRLDRGSLRALVAVAKRFPAARVYGARARHETGAASHSACLADPSVRQALAYALGLHRARLLRRLAPDELGGWKRDTVRHVPVLTGSLLLVDALLWARLDGFDESFVLYGEDVDFCLRARVAGANPLFSHLSGYTHIGGTSFSAAEREVLILRGKAELYRRRLPRVGGALAVGALELGVALRAGASFAGLRDDGGKWPVVLAARRHWRAGFREPSTRIALPVRD